MVLRWYTGVVTLVDELYVTHTQHIHICQPLPSLNLGMVLMPRGNARPSE